MAMPRNELHPQPVKSPLLVVTPTVGKFSRAFRLRVGENARQKARQKSLKARQRAYRDPLLGQLRRTGKGWKWWAALHHFYPFGSCWMGMQMDRVVPVVGLRL